MILLFFDILFFLFRLLFTLNLVLGLRAGMDNEESQRDAHDSDDAVPKIDATSEPSVESYANSIDKLLKLLDEKEKAYEEDVRKMEEIEEMKRIMALAIDVMRSIDQKTIRASEIKQELKTRTNMTQMDKDKVFEYISKKKFKKKRKEQSLLRTLLKRKMKRSSF